MSESIDDARERCLPAPVGAAAETSLLTASPPGVKPYDYLRFPQNVSDVFQHYDTALARVLVEMLNGYRAAALEKGEGTTT